VKKRTRASTAPENHGASLSPGVATGSEEATMESAVPFDPDAEAMPEPMLNLTIRSADDHPTASAEAVGQAFLLALEERVRRLEEEVVRLRDERITDGAAPVSLPDPPPDAEPGPAPSHATAPTLAPTAVTATPPAQVGIAVPPAAPMAVPVATAAVAVRRRSLFADMWVELQAIRYMFFDPRYSMSFGGRMLPLLLMVLFLTTGLWPFSNIAVIGPILQKGLDLIIGFALFKVLSNEARRYRETAPDLPPFLRL
jgi:hypothetical protein